MQLNVPTIVVAGAVVIAAISPRSCLSPHRAQDSPGAGAHHGRHPSPPRSYEEPPREGSCGCLPTMRAERLFKSFSDLPVPQWLLLMLLLSQEALNRGASRVRSPAHSEEEEEEERG